VLHNLNGDNPTMESTTPLISPLYSYLHVLILTHDAKQACMGKVVHR